MCSGPTMSFKKAKCHNASKDNAKTMFIRMCLLHKSNIWGKRSRNSRNRSTIRNLALLRFKDFSKTDVTLRRLAQIFQGE